MSSPVFVSYFDSFWWTNARTDAHSGDYHKHRLPIQREKGSDANVHRTNRMKQSWSIHFPHQLICADTRDSDASSLGLTAFEAGKIILVESLFSFPDFQLWPCVGGCNM